ncbi:hypothetical protein OQA88_7930 [Cercophora sp. LCS_1]
MTRLRRSTTVRSITTAIQGPVPEPQESIVKLLSDLRTDLRDNTAALRENKKASLDLKSVLEKLPTREDLESLKTEIKASVKGEGSKSTEDTMIQLLTEMRDALSKLPGRVPAFPEAPGQGMHGQSSY